METRLPRWTLLIPFLLALPALAVEDASESDDTFWSDPRGIILPMGDEAPDMVRLGELRERFELGMAHLEAGRWSEASQELEGIAAEFPVPEVLLAAAVSHFQLEQYGRAEQLLGLALLSAPDDVRCTNLMGLVLGAQGKALEAVPHLQRCVELALTQGNRAFEAYAMLNLAQARLDLGEKVEASQLAGAALEIGREKRFGNVTASAHNTLGNIALYSGDLKEAERFYRRSARVERRGQGNDDTAAVLNNLANVLAARGDTHEARELLLRAVEAARAEGRRTQEGGILVTLAGLEQQLGNTTAVDPLLDEALSIFEHLDLARGISEVRLQQARVARARHHGTEAMDLVEMARLALRGLTLPQAEAEIDLLEAEILLDAADSIAARKLALQAHERFATTDQPNLAARAALAAAEASAALGQHEQAREGFAMALATLESGPVEASAVDAKQRYGLYLLGRGETEEGLLLVQQALAWMEGQERVDMMAELHNLSGAALADTGELHKAQDSFAQARFRAAQAGDASLKGIARSNQVTILAQLERWDEAIEAAGPEPSKELLDRIGLGRARGAFEEGLTAMEEERWDVAVERMEAALQWAPAEDRALRIPAHSNLRMIAHHLGLEAAGRADHPTAVLHLDRALEHAAYEERPDAEANILTDLARVRFELGDEARALELLEQALPAAVSAGDEDLQRMVRFHVGLVVMETDEERARTELEAALAIAPDAGDELAAACLFNLGILLFRSDQTAASRDALVRSADLYRSLGSVAQVEQIESYLQDFPELETP